MNRAAIVLVALAALAAPQVAAAQSVASTESRTDQPAPAEPSTAPMPPPQPAATAADVAGAPLPGEESGRLDEPPQDSYLRRVARAVLFPPKALLGLVLDVPRTAVWAEDRYHVTDLYYRWFYNADRSIGVVPTMTWATGYGFAAGARFVDHNTFGDHEVLNAEATSGVPPLAGYDFHQSFSVALNTGRRLGRVQLGITGNIDRRPNDPFYGIGNNNAVVAPSQPIDPRTDPTAVGTEYKYQELRTASWFDVRFAGAFHVRATGAITNHEFARGISGPPIDEVYATSGLVGWDGFTNLYGELDLRYDHRRRVDLWEPHDLHAEGLFADIAAGRVHELDNLPDFWRGSVEVQEFWRIARGPRLLALRFRSEAVSGSTSEVPFSELPMLGGADFLRGYDFERFRDRVSALGSVEYVWDLAHWFDAALFVDVGRVYDSLSALGLHDMRLGYGIALEINNDNSFLFELSAASSIDGGLFFNLSFNPVYDARPRWR